MAMEEIAKNLTTQSECTGSDTTDNLPKILTRFKEDVLYECIQIQDFFLPDEIFSEMNIFEKKKRLKSDSSGLHENCLHRALRDFKAEVMFESTHKQDFCLPTTFHHEVQTLDIAKDCYGISAKKRKRKGQVSTRTRREKDRERKRRKREEMKGSGTFANVRVSKKMKKSESDNLRYRTDNTYKQSLKQASKEKYRLNTEHQEKLKSASKTKYWSDIQHQQRKKQSVKDKYRHDELFHKELKQRSVQKYKNDKNFQEKKKQRSVQKYNYDKKFKEMLKQRSVQKYKNDKKFQEMLKLRSVQKYKYDEKFQEKKKQRSVQKYKYDKQFREKKKQRSVQKYKYDKKFQEKLKQRSMQKYSDSSECREKIKQANKLRYRLNVLTREKYKLRLREEYRKYLAVKEKKINLVKRTRLQKKMLWTTEIASSFRKEVKNGPKLVCCVCHKFKFKKQVVECQVEKYSQKGPKAMAMANQCITDKYQYHCTNDCHENCETLNHNKLWICFTCHRHLLKAEMPADAESNNLKLPPIPEELVSMNRLEKQVVALRIPFMKLVQLPKGGQKGIHGPCVSIPADIEKTTSVLPRSHDENHLIRLKLKRKLAFKGHSQYEFISTNRVQIGLEYLQKNNPLYSDISIHPSWQQPIATDVADFTVEDDMAIPTPSPVEDCVTEDADKSKETLEDEQNVKLRGLPSDTCLQPVDIGQEILDQHFDKVFCVAPGEGSTPVNMLQEIGNEAMSFPAQFARGITGTYDDTRPVRLTRLRYLHARLLNADNRFSSDTAYIFYAQYLSELEQVISKVSIAVRKGTASDSAGRKITANMLTDRGKLKEILTTDQGYKFLTPIRGTPPYWQATLRDLMAMIRQLGIPTWFCTFSAADMRWTDILQALLDQQGSAAKAHELDWTQKCELLKNNPVMNAVMFDHRFHTFLKLVIIDAEVIGKIKDHFHRIEFQQRGSPHAHCLFWVKDAPLLDEDNDQTVCDFVDKYVCSEVPIKEEDPELHEMVTSVQQHSKSHSKSCRKKGTTCRFNFPRPPSLKTFVSRTQSLTEPSLTETPQQMKDRAKDILNAIWTVINSADAEMLTTQDLFTRAGVTQQDYERASNILTKRTNIVLQRKPSDIWINQYNRDLLRCWNANMDIQYVTDAYSCVMYIISYISKSEREMGVILENARKEAAEGNSDAQETMKKIGGAYFRQREVSAQEAVYRVCGLHLKESSRKVQFIPAGDNQIRMSLPLNVIQRKSDQLGDENIWMSSLYDKYKARPDGEEFESLSYASFCSHYRILAASQVPKNITKSRVNKLKNDLGYIQKRCRTEDAVVRYPRFSVNKNAELHYKSILQLFLPHKKEEQLKPPNFTTYEEFYLNGAVALRIHDSTETVKTIVESNRQGFEKNAQALDDAQDLIDRHGPMEDAWALIAPESEAERLESEMEKEEVPDEDCDKIIELETPRQSKSKGKSVEVSRCTFTSQEIQPLLQTLNVQQKRVFYSVRQWCLDKVNGKQPEPFRIFISGGAGTGKSHLIKCLYFESTKILSPHAPNPDDIVVLMTAPTATAAFNIGGTTLHQAFSLTKSLPLPYVYKRDDELNTLRTKLQNMVILIIDEISMVGQRLLTYVSERLRQIKQSGNALFGNVCVIAVGDFYQLPPVKQKCLYDLRPEYFFPLWSVNFSLVQLHQVMRQKDDIPFANLLNRLRVKKKKDHLLPEDLLCLEECASHSVPPDTLHIFGTNREVDIHNNKMIADVCEVTQTIYAQDYDKDSLTGKLTPRDTPYDSSHDYLPSMLSIGPKARVMLVRNVDISLGLVNGAMGTVVKISAQMSGTALPKTLQILFDNWRIGPNRHSTSKPRKPIPVNIEPFEETLHNNAVRHQFPVRLAWGCTTHKVQGITTDKAVVSFKHIFSAGMAYVALSRVTSIQGLVIQDFDQDKIYCTEQIAHALQRMPQYLPPPPVDIRCKTRIMLHNVQGLISHIHDMRSNSDITDAHFICLTETWMEQDSVTPSLQNFHLLHHPRHSCYSSRSPLFEDLKQKKHGGVGIYFHKDQQCQLLTLDHCNIEFVAVYIQKIDTVLVVLYRPEVYTVSVFLEQLHQLLLLLPKDKTATLIVGDFNQDILKTNSSIQGFMDRHGFRQLINQPTTDGGTLIDHAYISGTLDTSIAILPTYYSYHNMICIQGGWTPLMWACYKGRVDVVMELLDRGANSNIKAEFSMTCLAWAAGRGYTDIVNALLQNGAKVNMADKYGTTPLIWAARKGYMEIVEALLNEGASVDVTGMNSWTALLVATKGGFTELVSTILEFDPNVNAVDKDGYSALTIAAKEGYIEIAHDLLAEGAYVNVADRAGDTILIHAVKTGHVEIVRALLNKYADVDVQGCEGKTALYWAVEKGHVEIAKSLLDNDPDLELCTKDEDTALMRAVRNRNEQCVRLLLDKGAKVSAMDKRGDTALHISLRARSKRITELLLRNPRNSRLLYRSNKAGETPYNIDAYHQKGILSQIFGHRNLNASDGENLLGYEIYSSALADILSDPSLNTPITVGLYAKWGSGKSFLLSKLQREMKSFTKESVEEHFTFCWALFFTLLLVNNVIGVTFALALQNWAVGLGVGLGVFPFEYSFLGLVYVCAQRFELRYAVRVSFLLGRKLLLLTLLLKVLFCHPKRQNPRHSESSTVKFLFSESTRLVTVGGEKSLAAMVGTLGDVLEQEYGFLVARLFRVFKPTTDVSHTGRFKSLCCIPYFVIVIIVVLCVGVGVTLLVTNNGVSSETPTMVTMITLACIVGLAFISNIYTWGQALMALFKSQQTRIIEAADQIDTIKMDGLMQKLKLEVDLMSKMVTCMDKFTSNQTRLVVIVDGLDSCEQDKVLQVLDIIKALFSDEDSPFITILAVDPHIIIKGIESNLKLTFNDSNVNGFDYLRNAVHLPFYLQSQGMSVKKQDMAVSPTAVDGSDSPTRHKTFQHQESVWSSYSTFEQKSKTKSRSARRQESVASHTSSQDLSLSLTKNDYFSDMNPRSMRRLLNIVAVTGRLLRAYNIEFNWHRLAAWTNIIEQWPYRVSWIIMHFEENEMLDNSVTLANIYERISDKLPITREVEPLLEIDRNVRKLEAFLCTSAGNGPVLNVGDLKKFLPCTVNLDPYLRKLIRDLQKNTETFHLGQVFPRSPSAGGIPAGHMGMNGPMNAPIIGHMTAQGRLNDQTVPQRRAILRTPGSTGTAGPDRGMLQPHVMTPYGAMPFYPGYMGYSNPYLQHPSLNSKPQRETVYPAMHIEGYSTKKLSTLTVEEICDVVSKIQGINKALLQQYQDVIKENNLCGMVLSTCNLEELGKVLCMKFGDWQLFKSAILLLQQQEEEIRTEEELEHLEMEQESMKADMNRQTSGLENYDVTDSKSTFEFHGERSRKSSMDSNYQTEYTGDGQNKKSILTCSGGSRRDSIPGLQERKKSVQIDPDLKFSSISEYGANSDSSGYRHLHRQSSIGSDNELLMMRRHSQDSCSPQFQHIRKGFIKRNDSVVKQIEFEKGLLHTAMLHFTEEEELEDTDNEKNCDNNDSDRSDRNGSNSPPIKFMLSDDDDTESNSLSVVTDTDPLLSLADKQSQSNSSLSKNLERHSKTFESNSFSQQKKHLPKDGDDGSAESIDSVKLSSVSLLSNQGTVQTKLGSASLNIVDETTGCSSSGRQSESQQTNHSPADKDKWQASVLPSGRAISLTKIGLQKRLVSFDETIQICEDDDGT